MINLIIGLAAISTLSGAQEQQLAQPAPVASLSQPVSPVGAPLWRNLRYGMSAEEAAAAIRSMEGVRDVAVKGKKKPELRIRYTDQGIDIGPSKATIDAVFGTAGLTEVILKTDECASAAVAKGKTILETFREKMGDEVMEKVVDEAGAPVETRFAFSDAQTRIRMTLTPYNAAAVDPSAPGSGAFGALADVLGAISSNEAQKACPADQGLRAVLAIGYSSQAIFLVDQAEAQAKRDMLRQKAREGL